MENQLLLKRFYGLLIEFMISSMELLIYSFPPIASDRLKRRGLFAQNSLIIA